jgi:hypothetical protein
MEIDMTDMIDDKEILTQGYRIKISALHDEIKNLKKKHNDLNDLNLKCFKSIIKGIDMCMDIDDRDNVDFILQSIINLVNERIKA